MNQEEQLTAEQKRNIQESLQRLRERLAVAAVREEDVLVEVNALLSSQGIERVFGIPNDTLENWRRRGWLPFVLVGKSIRYRSQDVEDCINRHFTQDDFERLYPLPNPGHEHNGANGQQILGCLA